MSPEVGTPAPPALGAVMSAAQLHDPTLGGRALPTPSVGWPSMRSPHVTVWQVTHLFTSAHHSWLHAARDPHI